MSLSSCHCKHRPAFVCIRSLCNHCEGCGALLQKEAQARALSGRVRNAYGWSLFLETDGASEMSRWHCSPSSIPCRLFKGSLQLHPLPTATFITAQTQWLNRASDEFSLLLATKRQLTALEHRGIVKVVTEEISPFKRKSKTLGKLFLPPPHFSWVHTGAVEGSKSSSAPQEQCYTLKTPSEEGGWGWELSLWGPWAISGWPLSGVILKDWFSCVYSDTQNKSSHQISSSRLPSGLALG